MPVDYQKGLIYKIVALNCDDPDEIYFGSTTQGLAKGMGKHRINFKQWKEEKYRSVTSFILFEEYGNENCKILLVENYPCNSKNELEAKEAEYIIKNKCVNKHIPNLTKERKSENSKQYRTINADKIKKITTVYRLINTDKIREHQKQYRTINDDKISFYYEANSIKLKEKEKAKYEMNIEMFKERHICCCSGSYTYKNKAGHFKSKKHQTYILNNPESTTP